MSLSANGCTRVGVSTHGDQAMMLFTALGLRLSAAWIRPDLSRARASAWRTLALARGLGLPLYCESRLNSRCSCEKLGTLLTLYLDLCALRAGSSASV